MAKGHYLINDYTELTSYTLENYEEVKDITYCKKEIYRNFNDNYKRGNDRCIKAFQVFRMLMDNVDKLITPMELTEVLNAQFYDKVDDWKTLGKIQKTAD